MATAKSRALDALVDEDWQGALDLFDQAAKESPADFDVCVGRAAAFLKLDRHVDAVSAAKRAVELAPDNYRGYLRKGEAAFHLEEYESAREDFRKALKLGAPAAKAQQWVRKCQAELDDEEEQEAAPAAASAPKQAPESVAPATPAAAPAPTAAPAPSAADAPALEAAAAAPQPKYRHQFFQTQAVVEVAVLAKGLTPERARVAIEPRRLAVTILDAQGQQEYELRVELAGEVDPARSRHEILRTKLEIRLAKAAPAHWPGLEAGAGPAVPAAAAAAPAPAASQGPAYPSSFKRRPVDWDRLETELKNEEKDEKLEGDAALQKLFQGIYAGADEDTRRAMNKSFQESNGTCLSTNWKDVGSRKVEYKPA